MRQGGRQGLISDFFLPPHRPWETTRRSSRSPVFRLAALGRLTKPRGSFLHDFVG
jgi:hypothetical protein